MPSTTRTFRVFVSSTFEDLKTERDALQRDVFPKLRKLCQQHGARFQAIDLRWGVRDEAALDQKTMEICLREIRRCQASGVRPNFIALLGDRYGWQPLPTGVPAAEFDALLPLIPAGEARALARQWYRLDENADPPEYVLQPRTGEFTGPAAWSAVERLLHPALAAAARAAGVAGAALSKYTDSATHQEILAGLGGGGEERQRVFGFFRSPKRRGVLGLFKGPASVPDPRLEALKSIIPDRTEFAAGDARTLCDAVYERLARVEADYRRLLVRPWGWCTARWRYRCTCWRAIGGSSRLRPGQRRPARCALNDPPGCGSPTLCAPVHVGDHLLHHLIRGKRHPLHQLRDEVLLGLAAIGSASHLLAVFPHKVEQGLIGAPEEVAVRNPVLFDDVLVRLQGR